MKIHGPGSQAWGDIAAKPGYLNKSICNRALRLPWRLIRPAHDAPNVKDLVAMPPRYPVDGFIRWIRHECIPLGYEIWCDMFATKSEGDEPEQGLKSQAQRIKENKKKREQNGVVSSLLFTYLIHGQILFFVSLLG